MFCWHVFINGCFNRFHWMRSMCGRKIHSLCNWQYCLRLCSAWLVFEYWLFDGCFEHDAMCSRIIYFSSFVDGLLKRTDGLLLEYGGCDGLNGLYFVFFRIFFANDNGDCLHNCPSWFRFWYWRGFWLFNFCILCCWYIFFNGRCHGLYSCSHWELCIVGSESRFNVIDFMCRRILCSNDNGDCLHDRACRFLFE